MTIMLPGYQLDRILYDSHHSLIFDGIRTVDSKPIIVKLLKEDYPDATEIARFKYEYEITHSLHFLKSVIQILAFEKYHNSYAIIMEKSEMPTLREILAQSQLKIEDAIQIAIKIAKALGQIHEHQIIHKDINPSNILCDLTHFHIKVLDFGAAVNLSQEIPNIVPPQILEGTLAYISPEQTGRMNCSIDYRTDFYSLGIIFYEMLTGQLPFITSDPMELVYNHIAVIPKSPHEINPIIPEMISKVVMKLLAKNAEYRYQNINGVIEDLKICFKHFKKLGYVIPFTLARKDIFSNFQIPDKLYGREKEIKTLLDIFENTVNGKMEMVLVAGYPGIGKTSLIHEIYKPIMHSHGYFIAGKFEQFKHHIPYSAIAQAFQELINQLLTENETRINLLRDKITEEIGTSAQILLTVIPSFIEIIGEKLSIPLSDANETQNMLRYVFLQLMHILSDKSHPLVIFLDDLQYADLPSLNLIELLLTNQDFHHIMIIGSYRSNEVDENHPLMTLLVNLQKQHIHCDSIMLGPLSLEDVDSLLADTLHCSKTMVHPLAKICTEKTHGNPFYLTQLLHSLYTENLIYFNFKKIEWQWDTTRINNKEITDNVVHFIIEKIQQLTPQRKIILQLAACIGNRFNLNVLANISQQYIQDTLNELQLLIKEGFIISLGKSNFSHDYQFKHDRIQQAAYTMLSESERKTINFNIAQLIFSQTPKNKLDEVIFEIADHFNSGIELSKIDRSKQIMIAEINLIAAINAKNAAAFQPALHYIKNALTFLIDTNWQTEYSLTFAIYNEAIELFYLNANFKEMENYANLALNNINNLTDKIKINRIQALAYIAQLKPELAIDLFLNVLEKLAHINFPKRHYKFFTLLSIMKIKWMLLGKPITSLVDLPIMTHPTIKIVVDILQLISSATYQVRPQLFPLVICEGIKLFLRYGNTEQAPFFYQGYGIIQIAGLGNIETGYQFGNLGIALLKKMNIETQRPHVVYPYNAFIRHWKEPVRNTIALFEENFKLGLELGDFEYAGYSITGFASHSYHGGVLLHDFLPTLEKFENKIRKLQQYQTYNYLAAFHQGILNLIEETSNPSLLVGTIYDEIKDKQKFIDPASFFTYVGKLNLAFLFQKYDEAIEIIRISDKILKASVATYSMTVYHLYKTLVLLSKFETSNFLMRYKIARNTRASLKKFKKWSKHAPFNHAQKYFLISAEWARVNKKFTKAAKFYNLAIESAKNNGFIQEEAVANELAGKFYLAQGEEKIAKVYIQEAHYNYLTWGSLAKAKQLEALYPHLIINYYQNKNIYSTSETDKRIFDETTVRKASQVISRTIILSDLLKKLMHIVIENAGAQKALLFLNKENKFYIEAEAYAQQSEEEIKVLQSEAISMKSTNIPVEIINYVSKSRKSVVAANAFKDTAFSNSPYIMTTKPKSILCIPLINQNILSGILYLENNLLDSAFTHERIDVLNLLSSQIAISIDNARLYEASIRFVPETFLKLLNKRSIAEVKLGDCVSQIITVMFTDIREYTALTEKQSAEEAFAFINHYLELISPIIRKHNGFILQYYGDAILAIFSEDPEDAINAAFEMKIALHDFNEIRITQNKPTIQVGYGINTGSAMLGLIGEKERIDANVISDAINLTARIESLNKDYKTSLLISSSTLKSLKDPSIYTFRLIDKIRVKGKKQPVSIYEILPSDINLETRKFIKIFSKAYHAYALGDFNVALKLFNNCLTYYPQDGPTSIFIERCKLFLESGTPDGWDGVYTMLTK